MKLLAEISEGTLGLNDQFEQLGSEYRLRKSVRVILLNQVGNMAAVLEDIYLPQAPWRWCQYW